MPTTGSLGLYFHIPFCRKICPYCTFFAVLDDEPSRQAYLKAVLQEVESKRSLLRNHQIASIYFGGGTPSIFPEACAKILAHLARYSYTKTIEITLEMNPEDVTRPLLRDCLSMGINRLSIGLQTGKTIQLEMLGRKALSQAQWDLAHQHIPNISLDLLYDLPHQTARDALEDVALLRDYPAPHISLYNLSIETGSFLETKKRWQPQQEASKEILETYTEQLEALGFQRYELFAFAKPGYEAQHNQRYWKALPYLGFGPSSHSYYEKTRFHNHADLFQYCQSLDRGESPVEKKTKLEEKDLQKELLILGLRLSSGVFLPGFIRKQGKLSKELQEGISKLTKKQFLEKEGAWIRLTKKGLFFYDSVAEELI
ncbi:MAG: radical SAM family heme chaperone HemW [Chlamydiota bacterium]